MPLSSMFRTPLLYGLHYSPWTERARWALDHHGVRYRYVEHVPMLGEPVQRLLGWGAGQERASVPLLRHEGGVIGDSLAIIRHADTVGSGSPLVGDPSELEAWTARVEQALGSVRALVTGRVLADPEALREAAMAASPAALAGALRPLASLGARFIARKYEAELHQPEAHRQTLRQGLLELRERLGGREHLSGDTLSAMDVVGATLLQGVRPVDDRFIALGPATRAAWSDAALAESFEDLLDWRDSLYRRRRLRLT